MVDGFRMKVKPEQISFVIQGPIYPEITEKTLSSLRRVFPGSEVIISTWEGADTSRLKADKTVFSKDPPTGVIHDSPKLYNSTNRQLVSTFAGLQLASREYAAKLRSDIEFTSDRFLKYFELFSVRGAEAVASKGRIVMSTIAAPFPRRYPLLFHPSDWFYFGFRSDLLEIFDLPLCKEPEDSRFFEGKPELRLRGEPWYSRYRPEQYIWSGYLKKKLAFKFEHAYDFNQDLLDLCEKSFANNAILLDPLRIGYRSLKHLAPVEDRLIGAFSPFFQFEDWLLLYKKYSDPNCEYREGKWLGSLRILKWGFKNWLKNFNHREFGFVLLYLLGLKKI